MAECTMQLITKDPVPVFVLNMEGDIGLVNCSNSFALLDAASDMCGTQFCQYLFRGVAGAKLKNILTHGIDVTPTDSVIFCNTFEKAFEYGDFPKGIIALDPNCLDRTFRETEFNIPDEEVAALRKTFPTMLISEDGKKRWFSRLPEDDRRIALDYETVYAKWIPGDPKEALKAVFLIETKEKNADSQVSANDNRKR